MSTYSGRPPPYQLPPTYSKNNLDFQVNDPFDTTLIYAPPSVASYNVISPTKNHNTLCKVQETNLHANDITNGTGSQSHDDNLSSVNRLDSNFIAELERCTISAENLVKESIPVLDPPPQKQHNYYANNYAVTNIEKTKQNNIAKETTIFNEIWQDVSSSRELKNSNTLPSVSSVHKNTLNGGTYSNYASTNHNEFGTFKCNFNTKNYDKCYDIFQNNTLHTNKNYNNTDLYANTRVQNTQLYHHQYNTVPSIQPYSEVAESVYTEIPDHIYSPVADDLLRPHRPAPPSPLVLGQPQSMQQIQRKILQGQVWGTSSNLICTFNE